MRRPQVDGGGEWVPSLALFTVLLPAAVGVYGWWILFQAPPQLRWAAPMAAVMGLIGATAHLGHLLPGPLALTRLKSSWLAREVVTAGVFTALAVTEAVFAGKIQAPGQALLAYRLITLAFGLVGGYASIQLYRVESHPAWRSGYHFVWGIAATLSLGSALALAFRPNLLVRTTLGVGMALDLIAFFAYCLWLDNTENPAHDTLQGLLYHLPMTTLRVALPVAGFSLAQTVGPTSSVLRLFMPFVYLFIGHFIHRMLFYRTGYKRPVVNLPYYARQDSA
ncbi:MAG: dimethyl sulfoxide reductase anchor subunit family protein [bacterium]